MALSARQQTLRRSGIGASEIAALAGLSRWARPIEIYEAKLGAKPQETSYQAELGSELEAPIARVWAARHGKHLALVDTLQHPTKRLALATPDRAVYSDAILRGDARKKRSNVADAEALLQVKSSSWRLKSRWGPDGTDLVPDDFQAQAQWEAGVSGVSSVIFAVDFDKTNLHEYKVQAQPQIFEALYEIAERFWTDHVLARKPPPPDASDKYAEFLDRVFPCETSNTYREIAPGSLPEFERDAAEFMMLRAADKRLKARKDLLYQRIVAMIGNEPGLRGSFGIFSYKRNKDSTKFDAAGAFNDAVSFVKLQLSANPQDPTAGALLSHLERLQKEHTKPKSGWRSLRPQAAPHLQFEAPITLTLAAEGENQEEES